MSKTDEKKQKTNIKNKENMDDNTIKNPIDSEEQILAPEQTSEETEAGNDAATDNLNISGDFFAKFARLEEEVALYKNQAMRLQAEVANTQRRSEQAVEKAHKFSIEKLAKELIPVVDSLEKGIETAENSEEKHQSFIDGLHLILKQLLSALAKFGMKQVDPLGEPFDPNYHQAVATVPKPEAEPNTVVEVCQKGCTLHDRVLRPAMVLVAAK